MSRARTALLALLVGSMPLAAQEPQYWRDPDQGCVYIVTPQGGVGLRYRRDGSPDCPDGGSHTSSAAPTLPAVPRGTSVAPVTWPGTTRPDAPAARVPPAWSDGPSAGGPRPRPPVTWPVDPSADATRSREAILARGIPQSFTCWAAGEGAGSAVNAQVRVRVEPQAKFILVDSSGGREVVRYTLDSTGDLWFNGRNERDPRLGIILSPSRGHMWLDTSTRSASRPGILSQPFDCRPEGALY